MMNFIRLDVNYTEVSTNVNGFLENLVKFLGQTIRQHDRTSRARQLLKRQLLMLCLTKSRCRKEGAEQFQEHQNVNCKFKNRAIQDQTNRCPSSRSSDKTAMNLQACLPLSWFAILEYAGLSHGSVLSCLHVRRHLHNFDGKSKSETEAGAGLPVLTTTTTTTTTVIIIIIVHCVSNVITIF